MSLYVLITGFGPPFWEHKLQILENNLQKICSYKWDALKIKVCQYASPRDYKIPSHITEKYPVEIVYSPGIVGEFIKKYADPTELQSYTHIMLLLDDIELQSIDFNKALQYQKELNLDIVSPCLTHDSKIQYRYMLQDPNQLFQVKVASSCEYFCYLFTLQSFTQYYQYVTFDNPWMWGLDLLLYRKFNFNVGLLNEFTMKHWYKSESYKFHPDVNPVDGFRLCLSRYGETEESANSQKAFRYMVMYV
jgi:hypothetical protein